MNHLETQPDLGQPRESEPPQRIAVALGIMLRRVPNNPATTDFEVLITQRPEGKPLAGLLEFPGGKIEPEESAEQAVQRELVEEVGMRVQPFEALPTIEHVYPHAKVVLHPMLCNPIDAEPSHEAGMKPRWMRVRDLDPAQFPEANFTLLEQLQQWVARQSA